jgi:hypothetical protein
MPITNLGHSGWDGVNDEQIGWGLRLVKQSEDGSWQCDLLTNPLLSSSHRRIECSYAIDFRPFSTTSRMKARTGLRCRRTVEPEDQEMGTGGVGVKDEEGDIVLIYLSRSRMLDRQFWTD